MKDVILSVWADAKTPVDYIIALWITVLFGMWLLGMSSILYAMLTGQIDYDSLRFGLFDNPI